MSNDTRPCYYRNGDEAKTNVPCSSETNTFCCDAKDICLSNGLCMNIGHQPYVLSRGSCTNQAWDQGCPQYCVNDNPTGGCSIINLKYTQGVSTYCCGTPISNGTEVVCPDGSSGFQLHSGDPVYGRAILTTHLQRASSSPESRTCHDIAIGAGVGVPLGVVALFTTAWAAFERRRSRRTRLNQIAPTPVPPVINNVVYEPVYKPPPVELSHTRQVAEIMGAERS